MSAPRRGGPARMEPAELEAFLAEPRWAGLCLEDEQGRLRAVPAWIAGGHVQGDVEVTVPAGALPAMDPAPACLVADRFESYVGIRGAILRGRLRPAEAGDEQWRLTVAKAHGFSFANTTVSL